MTATHINCEEVIERLFGYLDSELDEAAMAAISRHLEHCRDCYTRADFEKKIRAKVAASVTTQAPERLHHRIRSLLDEF